MPKNDQCLKEVYRSVVDYHNSLVNMRFTVAGLYLAGTAFLVNALFNNQQWCYTKITVCSLGIALTIIVFIIEARTYHLLENLGEFGGEIEKKFKLKRLKIKYEVNNKVNYAVIKTFFALMKKQPIPPRIPFSKRPIPLSIAKCITHTNGLYSLYFVFLVFWAAMWYFF